MWGGLAPLWVPEKQNQIRTTFLWFSGPSPQPLKLEQNVRVARKRPAGPGWILDRMIPTPTPTPIA